MQLERFIIIISGPTASGKSALAHTLAQAHGGELINIDSVQLFKSFDIGSAKPPQSKRKELPHHLFDVLDGGEEGSAQKYVHMADQTIADVANRGRLPIVVGGTTLYITALLHGLVVAPEVDEGLRRQIESRPPEECWQDLLHWDPERAGELHPNDAVRIRRALELCIATGLKASALTRGHDYQEDRYRARIVIPVWPREQLYDRINKRSQSLVEQGILDETKRLLELYGEDAHGLRSIGYAECVRCIRGELAPRDLAESIAQSTRRLAKRQLTYWRNEPVKRGWQAKEVFEEYESFKDSVRSFPGRHNEVWYVPAKLLGL